MRARLRNYARVQPSSQWFRIVNQSSGPSQVYIYDEIGFFGVSAADFNNQIDDIDGAIDLYINSPGGEIFDGISIYNQLLRHADVSVFIDGIAASAASYIAQAASPGKLGMAKNSKMMIHNGQAFAAGDAADLRKMADLLEAETSNIASIYADRSGRPSEDFLKMMADETWLSASEACLEGLADYVYDPRKGPSNVIQRSIRNAATQPYVPSTQTRHEPMTGTHTHDHAAYGAADHDDGVHTHTHTHNGDAMHHVSDGHSHSGGWLQRNGQWVFDPDPGTDDDDYQASTDTDHDYWSEDGIQLRPIPAGPAGSGKPAKPMPSNVKKPHGDVEYADPGYLDADGKQASDSGKEGVARYPIDAEHVQAAWSYINQEDNASQYTAEQLASIKKKIKSAMKKNGHDVSEDAIDLSHLLALGGSKLWHPRSQSRPRPMGWWSFSPIRVV